MWYNNSNVERRHRTYLKQKWREKYFDPVEFDNTGKISTKEAKKMYKKE